MGQNATCQKSSCSRCDCSRHTSGSRATNYGTQQSVSYPIAGEVQSATAAGRSAFVSNNVPFVLPVPALAKRQVFGSSPVQPAQKIRQPLAAEAARGANGSDCTEATEPCWDGNLLLQHEEQPSGTPKTEMAHKIMQHLACETAQKAEGCKGTERCLEGDFLTVVGRGIGCNGTAIRIDEEEIIKLVPVGGDFNNSDTAAQVITAYVIKVDRASRVAETSSTSELRDHCSPPSDGRGSILWKIENTCDNERACTSFHSKWSSVDGADPLCRLSFHSDSSIASGPRPVPTMVHQPLASSHQQPYFPNSETPAAHRRSVTIAPRCVQLVGFQCSELNTFFVESHRDELMVGARETYWSNAGMYFIFYSSITSTWVVEKIKRFKQARATGRGGVAHSPIDCDIWNSSALLVQSGWLEWSRLTNTWEPRPGAGVAKRGRVRRANEIQELVGRTVTV